MAEEQKRGIDLKNSRSDDVSVAYGSPELHQLVSVPQRRKLFSLLSSVSIRNPGIILHGHL
jgi:hypothetical protein